MKMMRRKSCIWAVVTAILVAACAIEPPLHLRQALRVIVKVLWKAEVYPEGIKPSGVSLYFFRSGEYYMQQTTSAVDSCRVELGPGQYRLYMISQSPEEYAWMQFSNLEDFDAASVSVVETKSTWYSKADDEVLIGNPEMMTAAVSEDFEVTAEMIEELRRKTAGADDSTAEGYVQYFTIRVPVAPRPVVAQYWISIYSENVDVLKAIRASTTGMARTYHLTQGVTGPESGTQLITQWKLIMDDPVNRIGHIDGIITTFGFPSGDEPSPDRDPALNVAALLVDNKTVDTYEFQVGNLITSEEPPEGYRALYRLILGTVENPAIHPPDVHPADEASGLNAIVDDWDEEETIDVEM